ncbi:MAG: glycosyltransferase, partial [Spirochaetia bacterium]
EELNITGCLESLLEQDYPNYEILVIDDNSNDRTWHILSAYAKKYKKLKVFRGKPLPRGWVGKQYACQQLIDRAQGEYILFTDADTIHNRQSLSWAVTNMLRHNADFMSAFLQHLIGSLGEALIVPAIYIMTTILMPLWKIPQQNSSFLSFAIGQFMVCRRKALLKIGGYTSFKASLVEDISLARAMKKHGYKTIFLDGKNYIRCRIIGTMEKRRINGRYLYPLYTLSAAFIYWLTLLLVVLFDTLVYRMRIRGRRNLKGLDSGGFFISNHSLYLDPGIIAHAIAPRRTYFTAMEETFDLPLVGYYIRLLGAFPVSENLPFSSLIRVCGEILKQKKYIHFFPEGDLTYGSHRLADFKQGVFYMALLYNKPIIPIVIDSRQKRFFGIKLPPPFIRVRVTICKPIFVSAFKGRNKRKTQVIEEMISHTRSVMSPILQSRKAARTP